MALEWHEDTLVQPDTPVVDTESLTGESISRMKVIELRATLRRLGLPFTGKKRILATRLEEAIRGPQSSGAVLPSGAVVVDPVVTTVIPSNSPIHILTDDDTRHAANDIVEYVRQLTIKNEADYAIVDAVVSERINPLLNIIDETFDDSIALWNKGHKHELATKRDAAEPLLEALRIAKRIMGEYQTLVREVQAEEAKVIENKLKSMTKQALVDEAEKLLVQGDETRAMEILENLSDVRAPVLPVAHTTVKATGTITKMLKRYRVVDIGKVSDDYILPREINHKLVQQIVVALGKEAEGVIGGIEFYEEPNIVRKG